MSKLDLPDEKFDLATAFETIYFWPGLEKCFAEVYKVLKPDGFFMIVNESKTEEKWLLDLYGDEYGQYLKRVNRCIPWKRRRSS